MLNIFGEATSPLKNKKQWNLFKHGQSSRNQRFSGWISWRDGRNYELPGSEILEKGPEADLLRPTFSKGRVSHLNGIGTLKSLWQTPSFSIVQWENSLVNGRLNCIVLRLKIRARLWDLWVALGHWALGWFLNSSMIFLDHPQAEVRPRRLQGTWLHVLWAQGIGATLRASCAATQWALTVITLLYGYIMLHHVTMFHPKSRLVICALLAFCQKSGHTQQPAMGILIGQHPLLVSKERPA